MSRQPYAFPGRPVDLPTVRSEVSGELSLQLPEELAVQIAVAVAHQFSPEPTPDGPRGVGQVQWWWEPLTSQEAAAFLKTSRSTLSSLRKKGRVPVYHTMSETMPRYYRAQLVAWQLGLPIPLPPWTASNPFDWLWMPLTDRDACEFLRCEPADLESWVTSSGLPIQDRYGRRFYFRAQLLAWILNQPIPATPTWEDWEAARAKYAR